MSTLGSLFGQGSGSPDTSDALRYSAPKEPKKASPATAAAAPASAPVPAPAPTSRILASAAVRLFKVNAAGGYDTVEGGAVLGCVLMGLGKRLAHPPTRAR